MNRVLIKVLQMLGLYRPGRIDYIGGSDVLPAPLKPEEERRILLQLEQGEESTKQILIERNLQSLTLSCMPSMYLHQICQPEN